MTRIEDICGAAAGTAVSVPVSWWVLNDGAAREVPDLLGERRACRPDAVKVFLDHETPCGSEESAEYQKKLIQLARRLGCQLYNGYGVSYELMLDDHLRCRDVAAVCGDFSSVFGAAGALGIRLTPEQMARSLETGTAEYTVPETVAVEITAPPRAPADAKDLALELLRRAGGRLRGKALELTGAGAAALSQAQRRTLFQMLGATGALAAFYEERPAAPVILRLDGGATVPMVTPAAAPAEGAPAAEQLGRGVSAVFIGGCSTGRIEDIRLAAALARGRTVDPGVRATVSFATTGAFCQAADEGLIRDLMAAGFVVMNQGCGGCYAKSQGMVDGHDTVLSAGSRACVCCTGGAANTYLCSVRTAVAGALSGKITAQMGGEA